MYHSKKHRTTAFLVPAIIIPLLALFIALFPSAEAVKADTEVVTDWYSERHPEYLNIDGCVEEVNTIVHYVYERYLWHDGSTTRATGQRLVPGDYKFNQYVTSNSYSGVGKGTKKYNIFRSKEYDKEVAADSNGGYTVVNDNGTSFHAWSFYTVTYSQYRYRYTEITAAPEPETTGPETTGQINLFGTLYDDFQHLVNMLDGFELRNMKSGRMLNLYHGATADGSKFDTYPRDFSKTQLFYLVATDKGLQIRSSCSSEKRMGIKTSNGTPKAGDGVCLYTPSANDCTYWKINICGREANGIIINIESAKTPGLFIGHPDNDLKGEKRNGLVLCTDGTEARAQWYLMETNRDIHYDRDAAIAYAKAHWNDGYGKCAAFVSRCLAAGGLDMFACKAAHEYGFDLPPGSGLGTPDKIADLLIKEGLATETKVKATSNNRLNTKNHPEVQVGDVVIWKNGTFWAHTAIVSSIDANGDVRFYAHNNARNDEILTVTGTYSGKKCNMYLYHINDVSREP